MNKFILITDGNIYSESTNIVDFDNEVSSIVFENNLLSHEKIKEASLISLILLICNKLEFEFIITGGQIK